MPSTVESGGAPVAAASTPEVPTSGTTLLSKLPAFRSPHQQKATDEPLQRGLRCQRRGDHAQAVVEFTHALRKTPHSPPLLSRRAESRRMLGDYEQAIDDCSEALRIDFDYTPALLVRGSLYRLTGQLTAALVDFERAADLAPDNPTCQCQCGEALAERGLHHQAIAAFTRAIERDRRLAWAWEGRAASRKALGQIGPAMRDLTRAIRLEPLSAETYRRRAELFASRRDWKRAAADLRTAVRLDPELLEAWVELGDVCFAAGKPDDALAKYARALELEPNNQSAWLGRAQVWLKQSGPQRAIDELDAARAAGVESAELYHRRGVMLTQLARWDDAADDLDTAIELDPKLAIAHNDRGLVYRQKQDWIRELACYNTAIQLDAACIKALVNRASLFAQRGLNREAEADCTRALQIDPQLVAAYYLRGNVHASNENFEAAVMDFSEAIERAPDHYLAYNDRGLARARLGDYEAAVQDYNQALEISHDQPLVRANRGIALQLLGRHVEALEDFRLASLGDAKYTLAYVAQRGLWQQSRGDYASAALDYAVAARLDPQNPEMARLCSEAQRLAREMPLLPMWPVAKPAALTEAEVDDFLLESAPPAAPAPRKEKAPAKQPVLEETYEPPDWTEVFEVLPSDPAAKVQLKPSGKLKTAAVAPAALPPQAKSKQPAPQESADPLAPQETSSAKAPDAAAETLTAEASSPAPAAHNTSPQPSVAAEGGDGTAPVSAEASLLEAIRRRGRWPRPQPQNNSAPRGPRFQLPNKWWVPAAAATAVGLLVVIYLNWPTWDYGPQKLPTVAQVSADQLWEKIAHNPKSAQANYSGQLVRVTGRVKTISETGSPDLSFQLKQGRIHCHFGLRDEMAAAAVERELTVIGECELGRGVVHLHSCQIVPPATQSAE